MVQSTRLLTSYFPSPSSHPSPHSSAIKMSALLGHRSDVKLLPVTLLLLLLVASNPMVSGSMIPAPLEGALSPPMSSCAPEEYESAPCRCCKMGCWYTVARVSGYCSARLVC